MKRCPACQRTFSDDISFCLMDGTPLQPDFEQEQSTLIREPGAARPQHGWLSGKLPLVGCSVVGLFALIMLGVTAVIFFVREKPKSSVDQMNSSKAEPDTINKQLANLQQQQADIDKQKQQLENERKTIDQQKKNPPTNVSTPTATDPPTLRITFHRGSIQETISGSVVKRRSYVLRTLSGQLLSADVRSGGNCVVFSNGSISQSYTTDQGDSSLVVINNCASPANFRLTVFIR